MLESLDGFSVAATRQNAGRSAADASPRPPRPTGGANAPAATGWASVMVVSGSASIARLSQEAAALTGLGLTAGIVITMAHTMATDNAVPQRRRLFPRVIVLLLLSCLTC